MKNFKIGELVRLKSGGPKMTVESSDSSDGKVLCQWFTGNTINRESFPAQSLMRLAEEIWIQERFKNANSENYIVSINGIIFDKRRRTIVFEDQRVHLTHHEAQIMDLFLHHPGRTFSHKEIVSKIGSSAQLNSKPAEITRPLISRLISKLRSIPGAKGWIESVRGQGYVFVQE